MHDATKNCSETRLGMGDTFALLLILQVGCLDWLVPQW